MVLEPVGIIDRAHQEDLIAAPNPFQIGNEVLIELPIGIETDLVITDLRGKHVITLKPKTQSPDKLTFRWDGTTQEGGICQPGLYLVTARAGDRAYTLKVLLR